MKEITMIEIEKNIEIPAIQHGNKGNHKYPWLEMEVGDSFFTNKISKNKKGYYRDICHPANKAYSPRKFSQRTVEGGLRVWRIE
jgi:hypothetical protein